jgi:hypothetical protein
MYLQFSCDLDSEFFSKKKEKVQSFRIVQSSRYLALTKKLQLIVLF